MSLNSSATVEKVKYVGDYLEGLKESVSYTLDRAQLLQERLTSILGNEIPTTTGSNQETEFPLAKELLEISNKNKLANDTLDEIISRLRL